MHGPRGRADRLRACASTTACSAHERGSREGRELSGLRASTASRRVWCGGRQARPLRVGGAAKSHEARQCACIDDHLREVGAGAGIGRRRRRIGVGVDVSVDRCREASAARAVVAWRCVRAECSSARHATSSETPPWTNMARLGASSPPPRSAASVPAAACSPFGLVARHGERRRGGACMLNHAEQRRQHPRARRAAAPCSPAGAAPPPRALASAPRRAPPPHPKASMPACQAAQ